MKAFYILVLTVVVLIGVSSLVGVHSVLPEGACEAEVYIANQNKMTICGINPEQLGKTLQQEGEVLGFAVRYDLGKVSENQLLSSLKAQVVKVERVGDITLYYAYSHRMSNGVNVDGKKVNVQIAVTDSAITLGSPLIMGSY
ncbi:MAG: YwmB family TATA-box binding protein [Clostridia bacterium]|nr:YwmB family TATA-box binding protein [Clostridia bacterium]MDY4082988.1 YwmB family TATA-box binding protein [Eubacteriales bacterium]